MNRIHRVVFNHALGLFQAVSEHARGRGKRKATVRAGVCALAVAASTCVQAQTTIGDGRHEIVDGLDPAGDVDGTQPSPWNIGGHLLVGGSDTGTDGALTIRNGGAVSNVDGHVGNLSVGTVMVTGASSSWSNRDLYVGNSGQGTLSVQDGASVSASGSVNVGVNRGDARGMVEISGAGSSLVSTDSLLLGHAGGAGALSVEDGGFASASRVYMGGYPPTNLSGTGSVRLSGSDLRRGVLATGFLEVGKGSGSVTFDGGILRATGDEADFLRNFNAGDITFEAGGAYIDSNGHDIGVGADLQGQGGLTKLGAGVLTLSGQNSYAGATTIEAGTIKAGAPGAVQGDYVVGAAGTLDMDKSSATLSALSGKGKILFGSSGAPTLTIDQASDTSFSGEFGLKNVFGVSQATLNKRGAGTLILTGNSSLSFAPGGGSFSLGLSGGVLAIEGGGALHYGGSTTIGNDTVPGSAAALRVSGTGTRWYSGALSLGKGGPGKLVIQDGAQARSSTFAVIGYDAAGSANLGSGATWQQDGNLVLGQGAATGRLVVEGGSAMTTGGMATLGGDVDARGEAVVSNAHWTVNQNILLGDSGQASLDIRGGGVVEVSQGAARKNGAIGYGDGAVGSVSVDGAGSRWSLATLTVGFQGRGTLALSNGGAVESRSTSLGNAGAGNGSATVRGEDSLWRTWDLTVGGSGKGRVTLADGGSLDTGGSGIVLADAFGSEGTLQIGEGGRPGNLLAPDSSITFGAGDGTLLFNHDADDYLFKPELFSAAAGAGTVVHQSGTTTLAADSSGYTGVTRVAGGTLLIDNALGGSVHAESGGTLGGSGAAGSGAGSVVAIENGGALAPGGGAIGTFTVNGDLSLASGSMLDYQLGAPGPMGDPTAGRSDRVAVSGDLILGGTLNLRASGDPSDGDVYLGYYRLMAYGGSLTDNGLSIGHVPYADASFYEIQAGDGHVDLFVPAPGAPGDNALQHWQGGDGVWGASARQWLNRGGDMPAAWAGNHAVFKNQPGAFDGGVVTVVGVNSFKGLQFVDAGYRLQGPGSLEADAGGAEIRVLADRADIAANITGAGGIAKTGAGMLVLSGANDYAGDTTVSDGVLSVSSDASLGQGALAFGGGVLQVTGSSFSASERDIVWSALGGGFDIADASNDFRLGQNLEGGGDLIKRGAGTLTLAGRNAYGNTWVEQGRLQGDAESISGNIANAGTVAFIQNDDARYTGDITGVGGINGRMIKDGAGLLRLEGRSSLDWTVTGGALATAAARFGGNVRLDGAATGLTFTDAGDAVYGGTISGTGKFVLDGGGVWRLTGDSSGFTGSTVVRAGTLRVGTADGGGALGGSLDVLSGATLGGSGTVGAGPGSTVTLASGGTLAPGNSIGTLTIDGDLTFEAGSRFAVEVNPEGTDSDKVAVTGNATLNGGSLARIGAAGRYGLRSTYTILSAGGTLSGKFDAVSSDFAFLTPNLLYDYGARTVDLELKRNDRAFASAALTRNQSATAAGIESIGIDAGHAVYDAIAQLPDDAQRIHAGFDALSGEIHASARTALVEDSRFVRNTATDRLRAAFAAPGAPRAPVGVRAAGGVPGQEAADYRGPAAWALAFGSWGASDGDGNAAGLDRNTGGLLIGADRLVDGWRLGVLAGYSHTDFNAHDRHSSGKSDNYHLGFYGGTAWTNLGLRAGAAYSWHDLDTRRAVLIPGLSDNPRANYRAGTFQVFGELGYSLDPGNGIRPEPFANLAHVRLHTNGYQENAEAAALSGRSDDTSVTFSTLGLRAESSLNLGTAQAILRGTLGWRHAFGDTTPEARHGFSAGDNFTVAGVPIAKDSAVVEAGVDLRLTSSATFGLSYTGQLAGSAQDHGIRANLAIRF